MGHEVVLELLDERVAACRSETERLRGEAERINSLLQLCENELARLADAREVVAELPDAVRSGPTAPAMATATSAPVPPPRGGGQVWPEHEVFTERLLAALAGQGGPVRCRVLVEALGLEVADRHVERVRHHLKKAVGRGLVAETGPGLFILTRAGAAAGG